MTWKKKTPATGTTGAKTRTHNANLEGHLQVSSTNVMDQVHQQR